ncbi:MAG: TIGR03621 family F420-dependent LLM class oxidoreductase, partial [Acidimicrobiales bacterium]|nr:TIGR03621 family F420-dependent LLM class oxidoreductase [Acidimicrobiales bacterium]
TERVGLSMFVLANDHRHPAVLAKEIATIDVLSGGRVELGLGAGWMESEYRAVGVAFDPPGRRIERLAEAITVVRGLFSESPFTFTGDHYEIHDNALHPRPVRRTGIPLVLGGGAPRMLSLAAREADIVGIAMNNSARQTEQGPTTSGLSRASFVEQLGWVRDAAGARFDDLEINVRVLGVATGGTAEEGAAELAADFGCDPADLLDSPFAFVGPTEAVAERLLRDRDELGVSYYTVSQRHSDQVRPIVDAVGGR